MSIFDARYDRLSEIKKKRAANSPAQSGEVKAAGVSGAVKASPFDGYAVTSRPGKRNAPTAGASTNHAGNGLSSRTRAGTFCIISIWTATEYSSPARLCRQGRRLRYRARAASARARICTRNTGRPTGRT